MASIHSLPFSREQIEADYNGAGMTHAEIATKYECPAWLVQRAMRKWGMVTRPMKRRRATRTYVHVRAHGHPNGDRNDTIAEHRLIASAFLGRPLTDSEVVHHIDGIKSNNDPANLQVCSRMDNARFHHQLEEIAEGLYRAGLVTFAYPDGYRMSELLVGMMEVGSVTSRV